MTTVRAIIPAAGSGRRMGTAKQLLTVNDQPLLLGALQAVIDGGVDHAVIVTRTTVTAALGLAGSPRYTVVINDDDHSTMIDSIRMGIAAGPADGYLVLPGDYPGVAAADIAAVLAAFGRAPDDLIMAACGERRGHPLIVPAALVPTVHGPDCDAGLHVLRIVHADRVRLVDRGHDGVLRDLDTPDDLADWQRRSS